MTPDLVAWGEVAGSPKTVIPSGNEGLNGSQLDMTALASIESGVLVPCVGSP